MVYKNLVVSKEVLEGEFGVEELSERIFVSPIEWDRVLPDDWIERFKSKGYRVEEVIPEDPHLKKLEKNYRINNTLFLFVNRGVVESADRFYILVRNNKVREIIFLGTAASLIDELDRGDVNIPLYALAWENVSSKYVDVSEAVPKADEELLNKVTEIARKYSKKYGLNVGSYNHATVELLYEETEELLMYFREFNVGTVDMELSSLYRLARYFNKKAIGILRVGDRPLHKEHFWAEEYKRKEKRKELGKELIFDIVKELII